MNFKQFNKKIKVENSSKGVEAVKVSLVSKNVKNGEVNVTDLMLQGGGISTVWVYHPSELRWSHDG